jgi:hypothetical protein
VSLLQLRLSLTTLRYQLLRIHVCESLSLADKIAFVGQNVFNSTGCLGGNIDLGSFYSTVAVGKMFSQFFGLEMLPEEEDAGGESKASSQPEPLG